MGATGLVGLAVGAALLAACQPQSPTVGVVERHPVDPQLIAHDDSGMGNHGINQGPLQLGVPGRFGTAYSFSQPGSWIQVPHSPELNPEDDSFLVSAWVKISGPPPPGETMDVIRKGMHDTAGGELKLEIVADGRVKCTVKDDGLRDFSKYGPMQQVADGTWHRVGCARTPRRLVAILDDERLSKRARTGVISNDMSLAIGSKYGMEDSPGGLLDEVAYYVAPPARDAHGRLLPLDEQLERLRSRENAVGLWHLDEKDPAG